MAEPARPTLDYVLIVVDQTLTGVILPPEVPEVPAVTEVTAADPAGLLVRMQ